MILFCKSMAGKAHVPGIGGGENSRFTALVARCARGSRAAARLTARSSWSGGLSHPPLTIPPVQGRRPVYPAGRAFVPSPSLLIVGDFALPRTPIAQGPCPVDLRRLRSAPAPLTNRRPVGCAHRSLP